VRAIIPAAGRGQRLLPVTQARPKGLVEVAGRPLLAHALERLYEANISAVICVSGYCGEMLESALCSFERRPPLQFVRNPHYATTNSIASLALTIPWWDDDFLVLDSDILFTSRALEALLRWPGNGALVDAGRPLQDMNIKVTLRDGRVRTMDKNLPVERIDAEFANLSRWTAAGARHLAAAIERLLARGRSDVMWERAIDEIADVIAVDAVYTNASQWIEVNTAADLIEAERFFHFMSSGDAARLGTDG
jgi:choline kinase